MDRGAQPGSSVHGILQAILEWGAISFSRGSSLPQDQTPVSCISCFDRQILQEGISRTDKPTGETVGVGGVARNADTNTDEKAFWLITLNKLRGKNTGFYRNPIG